MMTNNIIGGMRKNMANENKEKLVRKPGKKKTGIRKRENSNTNGYLFMLPYALMFVVFILLPTVLAVVPVSYTHLDVYKRQPVCRGQCLNRSSNSNMQRNRLR